MLLSVDSLNMTEKIADNQKKLDQVITLVDNLNSTIVKQAATIEKQNEQI